MLIDIFSENKKTRKQDKMLAEASKSVCREMENAVQQFNEATESHEIESIIYKMKELESRYSSLIKQAKLKQIYSSPIFRFSAK